MNITRRKIWLYWFLGVSLASVLSATASMLYWHFTYTPEPNVAWTPIDDMMGMFTIMPLGWLLSVITPAGWLRFSFV